MCWYFSKLLNIFEIEWNRFPTGFICQPAEHICVCACVKVSLSFKAKQVESVSGAVRASNQSRDQPTIVEMKKMWFRLRFFTVFRSPATQCSHHPPSPNPSKLVCAFVVVFFLWKFPKTFRRHFVYFTSRRFSAVSLCVCGTNRGVEERERQRDKSLSWIAFGLPPSLRFLLSGFHSQLMFFACSWSAFRCCCCCCCICLLFILSLLLAISFKWCQSFFTCFAQVRWAYPSSVCVQIYDSHFIQSTNRKWFWIHYSGWTPALPCPALPLSTPCWGMEAY